MEKISKKIKTPDLEIDSLSKWVPLICAGGAVALSIYVLNEMAETKKELLALKKSDRFDKKIKHLEEIISKLSVKKEPFIKKAAPPEEPEVNIINDPEEEYEEVEVTDDEADEEN
jgi:hypothetical protein